MSINIKVVGNVCTNRIMKVIVAEEPICTDKLESVKRSLSLAKTVLACFSINRLRI